MKQSTLTRETAYPAAPQMGNGFVPPVDFDFKISVDLRGHDIRVYGFDGSQWNVIHDADGTISDFIADITHQKYYLESKTGSNQEVRVTFLSSLAQPNLHSFEFGSTNSSRKLHHFGDVPVYHGGEAGKFLTIRTDGSLAWLGADESFTVAPEGGQQGGGNPPPQASFLEELDRFNFTDGIVTDNHSGMGHGLTLNLDGDDIISYDGNGQPVEEEFTISWWMNLDTTQDAGTVSVLGRYNPPADRFALKVGGNINGNAHITTQIGTQTMFNTNSGMAVAGDWVHAAYTCKSNGSNLVVSLYINGTKLPGTKGYPLGTKILPSSSNESFGFGYSGASGKSVKGQFDSIQIEEGIALTDAQVAAIAGQTDRLMGIEAASQL